MQLLTATRALALAVLAFGEAVAAPIDDGTLVVSEVQGNEYVNFFSFSSSQLFFCTILRFLFYHDSMPFYLFALIGGCPEECNG